MADKRISKLCLMGVPVHNLSLNEAVAEVLAGISAYKTDKRPRYFCTANLDFFVNVHGLWPTSVRHYELLTFMRHADIVSADGMPLIWLSRCLGSPLKERVAGASLIPALAKACAEQELTFFLLGGEYDVALEAAQHLQKDYPGLRVVGVASPRVAVNGAEMTNAAQSDQEILQQLNECKPDVLLIGLGNPKQEIWFHRIQKQIHVPMSIGVGGTAKFLAGKVERAPLWMQNWGLEWFYRLCAEPKALAGRYLRDLFYLPFLAIPAIKAHFIAKMFDRGLQETRIAQFPKIRLIHMGTKMDIPCAAGDIIILDFTDVWYLSSKAIADVIQIVQSQALVLLFGVGWTLKWLFIGYRVWDLFEPHYVKDLVHLAAHWQPLVPSGELQYSIEGQTVTILGELTIEKDTSKLHQVLKTLGRPVTVDLRYCHHVDNAGSLFLLAVDKEFGH